MQKLEERSHHEDTIPLYDPPRSLGSMSDGCDLCGHIHWSLRHHPELKEYEEHYYCDKDCDSPIHVLDEELADVSLCELDGDFNIRVQVNSRKYRKKAGLNAEEQLKPHRHWTTLATFEIGCKSVLNPIHNVVRRSHLQSLISVFLLESSMSSLPAKIHVCS